MSAEDTLIIKEKIIETIKKRGPSLPVDVASATGQSILFASAFLSELLSEKKVKISSMKVGSSPLYYLEGQEEQLQNFSVYLKSKEREAHDLLKSKKFLSDRDQHPAIRTALRSIKDFAVPFNYQNQIYWRYYTVPLEEFMISYRESGKKPELGKESKEKTQTGAGLKQIHGTKKEKKRSGGKPQTRKKLKDDEKLFNKIKEFLGKKSIEIIGIEGIAKNELVLRVRQNNTEKIIIACNKKGINETEIIKMHQKIKNAGLPYIILSTKDISKKIINLISAIKDIENIEKID